MLNLEASVLSALITIAEDAGHEVVEVYNKETCISWEKDDKSPLTEADLRSNTKIIEGLSQLFPSIPVLSEESTQTIQATPTFFLVDPLDGTKEFLKRNGEFTVNIALIDHGKPTIGVVYAPAIEKIYFAMDGAGAWCRDVTGTRRLDTTTHYPHKDLRIVGSRSHVSEGMIGLLDKLEKQGYKLTVSEIGSSLKFCMVAEGRADVYPRLGLTSQWDTAAAQCILEQAGGVVTDWLGKPLSYGLNQPILNPNFIAAINQDLVKMVISLN